MANQPLVPPRDQVKSQCGWEVSARGSGAGSRGAGGPDSSSPGHVPTQGGRVKGKQGRNQKRRNVRHPGAKVRSLKGWAGRGQGVLPPGPSSPPPATPCA